MQLTDNKILITGGASGIGLGLTERFIKEGNTVIICGRRESVLQEASARYPSVITRVCDLENSDSRTELFDWITAEHGDLNVLINNAGVQNWMKLTDGDFMPRAKTEIATNIEAPLHLTTLFIGLKGLNTIINVTSGLAYVPYTPVPVYSATKAFFHSFTTSSRYLLKEMGIEVIDIIPPALNTDLGGIGLHDHAPPVADFIDGVFEQLKEGKTEIAFGPSVGMATGTPEQLQAIFNRLNP